MIGEVLERDPATVRVVRADSLTALPSNSPVGSRMAIMLGGAAAGAAKKIKETLVAIAAHNFECAPEDLEYRDGDVSLKGAPERKFTWDQLVEIAHRKFHKMPPGVEPGLQAKFVWEVPTGGGAADARGPHADVSLLFLRGAPRATSRSIRTPASPSSASTSAATTAA